MFSNASSSSPENGFFCWISSLSLFATLAAFAPVFDKKSFQRKKARRTARARTVLRVE
jgi:hypothetical protein